MPHKNEQLRTQDILFYMYLKTIDTDPVMPLGYGKREN